MKTRYLTYVTAFSFIFTTYVLGQDINKTIPRTKEKEVTITLESSFGSVNLRKGNTENVISVQYKKSKEKHPKLELRYKLSGSDGNLKVEMNPEGAHSDEENNIHLNNVDFDFERDVWYVFLNPEIEYDISSELGAGKSSFDFSDIKVTNLSISAGASSSKIYFDEQNAVVMKKLNIETGVSKFSAENLSNANFEKMKFEGGVGAYYLNFGGTMKHEADVDIEVGLGSITIEIPKNIGAMVRYKDSWLSNISVGSGFDEQRKGVYKTGNYSSSEGKLNIWVEASLGTVKIRQTR